MCFWSLCCAGIQVPSGGCGVSEGIRKRFSVQCLSVCLSRHVWKGDFQQQIEKNIWFCWPDDLNMWPTICIWWTESWLLPTLPAVTLDFSLLFPPFSVELVVVHWGINPLAWMIWILGFPPGLCIGKWKTKITLSVFFLCFLSYLILGPFVIPASCYNWPVNANYVPEIGEAAEDGF